MLEAGHKTVVVLKHNCIRRRDSVRSLTLLGILIGTKDTYNAIRVAFGPIYDAISRLNEADAYVRVPWAPALPVTGKWELSGEAQLPVCQERHFDVRTCMNWSVQ